MKINQIISETTAGATGSGSVATVSSPMGSTQSRNASIYGGQKVGNLLTGKKTKKPYANSLSEGKMKELSLDLTSGKDGLSEKEFKKKYGKSKDEMRKSMQQKPKQQDQKQVDEAKLEEEDKIIAVGKGHKLKTGLHGKDEGPKFRGFTPPFKSEGMHVSDKRGNSVCECGDHLMAPIIAKALNAYAVANEAKIQGGGVVAGGLQYEGKDPGEYDMEGDFAKTQLHTIRRMADILEKRMSDDENLPEWVQMKITKAEGMLVSATDYIVSQQERDAEERHGIEGIVSEKAVSKAQQRFMGMVHAVQKGEMKAPSKAVAGAAKGMSKKAGHDFAATKHKGLPEKVKK